MTPRTTDPVLTLPVDGVQDHLHPGLHHSLQAAEWIGKTIAYQHNKFAKRRLSLQTLTYAREQLREALSELDAFEAAVWPALASGSTEVREAAE